MKIALIGLVLVTLAACAGAQTICLPGGIPHFVVEVWPSQTWQAAASRMVATSSFGGTATMLRTRATTQGTEPVDFDVIVYTWFSPGVCREQGQPFPAPVPPPPNTLGWRIEGFGSSIDAANAYEAKRAAHPSARFISSQWGSFLAPAPLARGGLRPAADVSFIPPAAFVVWYEGGQP